MTQPPLPGDPTMQHQPPARQGSNTVLVATLVAVSMTLLFVLLSFLFLRDSSGDAASDVTATTTTIVLGTPTTVPGTTTTPVATTAAPAPQTTAPAYPAAHPVHLQYGALP